MIEKVDRNQRLFHYRKTHPTMSISAIGRVFHLQPEVAWRIIKKYEKKEGALSTNIQTIKGATTKSEATEILTK